MGLLAVNPLSLFTRNVFISPSVLMDILSVYRILGLSFLFIRQVENVSPFPRASVKLKTNQPPFSRLSSEGAASFPQFSKFSACFLRFSTLTTVRVWLSLYLSYLEFSEFLESISLYFFTKFGKNTIISLMIFNIFSLSSPWIPITHTGTLDLVPQKFSVSVLSAVFQIR